MPTPTTRPTASGKDPTRGPTNARKNRHFERATENLPANASRTQVLLELFRLYEEEDAAKGRGRILIFKLRVDDVCLDLVRELRRTGKARFAVLHRRNLVDLAVCRVRDCFDSREGYAVRTRNRSRASKELCFARRSKGNEVRAHIHAKSLPASLGRMEDRVEELRSLRRELNASRLVASEDLFAFEYTTDEAVFRSSVRSWMDMLESLIDDADEGVVGERLEHHSSPKISQTAVQHW